MCGRFNFTDEQLEEIKEIIREVNEKHYGKPVKTGEVYPTDSAAVLIKETDHVQAVPMIWGFPHFNGSGVIINARSESVMDKPMFRDSTITRRCIVPSTGFYEWKREMVGKTKFLINLPGTRLLYMAGIYNAFRSADGIAQNHFVVLTTEANSSIRDIHGRMPVILRPEEYEQWLSGDFQALFDRRYIQTNGKIA